MAVQPGRPRHREVRVDEGPDPLADAGPGDPRLDALRDAVETVAALVEFQLAED